MSIFFFSSRRRHTRCSRDWSSDVCSSDLRWGERLFAMLSAWQAAAALGLALLGANLFYSRWRKSLAAMTPTLPLRSRWPANVYMLLSVLAVLYVSTLAVPPHQ